jgi:hypothetical protein
VFALLVSFSGVGKIRRDPRQVNVIHETVGLPLRYSSGHHPLRDQEHAGDDELDARNLVGLS